MSAQDSHRAQVMAHRMVATTLMMKRQYQDAGMMVAREFCMEHNIDVYGIEQKLRRAGKPFGRNGQIDATEGGAAWFWVGRNIDQGSSPS
ncbi:MAG: hypothetical protein AB7G47_19365 [Mycolicibacterium sp.]|uniref:hypothetical protein n=1 Tax=Mycolicibacterium sp. TaxID=2320850 RepID=UPI003D0EEED2